MSETDLHKLSGEQLRREAAKADRDLSTEVTRLRAHDDAFRTALDWTLAVEDEQLRRRNR